MKKLKIAFFGHTSCKGCFFEFLILGEKILDLLKGTDIVHFKMIKEYNEQGPFDITFMDGAISSEKELKKLKEVREQSKFFIALGSCACYGGIFHWRRSWLLDRIDTALRERRRYCYVYWAGQPGAGKV